MADLEGIQARLDRLIEGRYEDKEQVLQELSEIKEEVGQVRIDLANALMTLTDKIDKNYVRKDVNDEKDKIHDARLNALSTQVTASSQEHIVLRNRVDRFAIAGSAVLTTIALFKEDLASFIRSAIAP